jgi:hypothetical protein
MMLAQLRPSPDVWHDLRVVVGAAGLVTSRGVARDWIGGWIYDLWLLERLAVCLGAGPLPPQRLGRAWTPPYGTGIGPRPSGTRSAGPDQPVGARRKRTVPRCARGTLATCRKPR